MTAGPGPEPAQHRGQQVCTLHGAAFDRARSDAVTAAAAGSCDVDAGPALRPPVRSHNHRSSAALRQCCSRRRLSTQSHDRAGPARGSPSPSPQESGAAEDGS